MNQEAISRGNTIYYRLIALWVLCEAMLGGVIHAAKIPVSGLIVGSCAVVCISLIAYYSPAGGNIIKATLLVAVFKMMLSPQSPPLAYFAVFFQGLLGEIIFLWNRKLFNVSCMLFGLIALLESGLQRILVLTIVYGNNFWKAINGFINELTGQAIFINYSLIIAGLYVILHGIMGLIVGWWVGKVPQKVKIWRTQNEPSRESESEPAELHLKRKKQKWLKRGVLIIWIFLLILYFQSYFKFGEPLLPTDLTLRIFLRSVIIILAWYFVVGPVVSFLLKKWLQTKQTGLKQQVQQILELLPGLQQMISKNWKESSGKKGAKKIIFFAKKILAGILHE